MAQRMITSLLFTLALGLGCHMAEAEDASARRPFWAEFEGVVEIDQSGQDGPAVLIRPGSGLPVRIDTDGIQEWRRREGRRVEVEGNVRIDRSGAVMEVVELSHEKGSWGSRSPLSLEGYVSEENGQAVLETRTGGTVPLANGSARIRSDRRVEIDGMLVETANGIAVEIHDVDYD